MADTGKGRSPEHRTVDDCGHPVTQQVSAVRLSETGHGVIRHADDNPLAWIEFDHLVPLTDLE